VLYRTIGIRDGVLGSEFVRSNFRAGVLSLVIEQPSWGGEIGRRFEQRFDGLLSADRPHIYRALDALERDGLVEKMLLDESGQERECYRATADGARAYRGWLRMPIPLSGRTRDEVMIRFRATRDQDLESAEHLLDDYERATLALMSRPEPANASVIERLADAERRIDLAGKLRWIAEARDELRDLASRRAS
jgi:DNA-binding PadR family transcriptional regulator